MSEETNAVAPVQVQLTVSGILTDLDNGLTRDNIQNKYKLSAKDLKGLFSHPSLKGKKTKVAPGFVLTDDTAEIQVEENTSTTENASTDVDENAGTARTEENMETQETF